MFKSHKLTIVVREDKEQKVIFSAIRVHVNAHECKRFIIVLKDERQSEIAILQHRIYHGEDKTLQMRIYLDDS